MKIKNPALYSMPLMLIAGIAYGSLQNHDEPQFVVDAISSVSSKMSYTFGKSECKAKQQVGKSQGWEIDCTSATSNMLEFSVLPADKAPYSVPTSYYLIARNDEAKKSANADLLSYLMINASL